MKRVLTAVLLVPFVVYTVLWANPWVFLAVVALSAVLSYREYDGIAAAYGFGAPGVLGYGAGALLLVIPYAGACQVMIVLALLGLVLAMRSADLAHALPRASLLVLGVIYVFGCWRCAIVLHDFGSHWLMYALLVSWTGDIGAYYVGKAFGRHRLADRVSPKKSWEGAAASVATSVLVAGAYLVHFAQVSVTAAVLLTALANVAGQFGDLVESAMKRGAGVKDSGALLPGHGGFLDRVDSALFVMPLVAAWLMVAGG
ncbi:MAG: phosphatidate cytidylyltransferase [Bryobacteraceae bacterium]